MCFSRFKSHKTVTFFDHEKKTTRDLRRELVVCA